MAKDKYDVRFNLIEEITEDDIRELIKQVNEIHQNTTFTTKDFLMFLIPVLFIFTVAMLVLLFI